MDALPAWWVPILSESRTTIYSPQKCCKSSIFLVLLHNFFLYNSKLVSFFITPLTVTCNRSVNEFPKHFSFFFNRHSLFMTFYLYAEGEKSLPYQMIDVCSRLKSTHEKFDKICFCLFTQYISIDFKIF